MTLIQRIAEQLHKIDKKNGTSFYLACPILFKKNHNTIVFKYQKRLHPQKPNWASFVKNRSMDH